MSLGSKARGVAGALVDGACRDVAEAEELGFPVFARETTPRTARGWLRQKAVGAMVVFAGVKVGDGDLVIADDSGVAFVPPGSGRAGARTSRADRGTGAGDRGGDLPRREHAAGDARCPTGWHRTRSRQHTSTRRRRGRPVMTETDVVRQVIDLLGTLPTAAISDALDRLALPGSWHGIGPLRAGQRACGPAFTAAYEPISAERGTVGDFLRSSA